MYFKQRDKTDSVTSNDRSKEKMATMRRYWDLQDGLSEMIESGRLTIDDIPDDYQWLVETLASLEG